MPKKKVVEEVSTLPSCPPEVVKELAAAKGVSEEAVYWAIEEALKKALINILKSGNDADIVSHIDRETGAIYVAQRKVVLNDDDITDDFLEISVEEANEGLKKPKYHVGDTFEIPFPVEDMKRGFAMAVKFALSSKMGEVERAALYDMYKDQIGEMISGVVERVDDRSITISLGRTSVALSRKEMIGDEFFKVGETVKVYIQEVQTPREEGKPDRGPQIQVTRSSAGFLKRLFELEIQEVYDGTVVIKGIARHAGVRSKVAVYSNNEDIDPTGACIGPGGSRIQKVVSQLGNSKEKEKIDIIPYSDNIGLYIAESLRPANVLGVAIEEAEEGEEKRADVIVRDEQYAVAVGRKGSNVHLASELTGYKLNIVIESEAIADGITYTPFETLKAEAEVQAKQKEKALYAEKSRLEAAKRASEAEVKKAAEPKEEPKPEPVKVVEEVKPEPVKVEEPKEEPKKVEEVHETVKVKTTTSLESLEKELEKAKEKKTVSSDKRKKPRKITEEEVEHIKPSEAAVNSATALPIYSDEELEEIEQEDSLDEDVDFDSDIDLADYDSYYE